MGTGLQFFLSLLKCLWRRKKGLIKINLQKQLIQLATPIILSNLAFTLLGAVDTLFMGHVSTLALGAVGLGSMTFLTASLFLKSTLAGATPFVSRQQGAGNFKEAGKYLQYFLCLTIILIPLIALLPSLFRLFFWVTKPDGQVSHAAMQYLVVRLFELPATLLVAAFTAFLLGVGNSILPMFLNWLAVLLNIGANYILVFGKLGFPKLGIVGAAWGTVFAMWIQALLFAIFVWTEYRERYRLNQWHWPSLQDLVRISKVGLPLGLTDSVEVGAFTTFFAIISRLGSEALAASQIVNQIAALAFMPGFALGAATGSLVGRYLGAQKGEEAERIGWLGTRLGVRIMVVAGIIFVFFSRPLSELFTQEPAVIASCISLLRLIAVYQIFDAVNIVLRGALNGAGDTRFTMAVTLILAWGLFVPGSYLGAITLKLGVMGAWLGALTYLVTLGVIFFFRFRRGAWREIAI
jgi:MATE family multidrug resistance protein